jgi:hypothetical protein
MQITNNHTTIEITEDLLMSMICHPRVNDLEIIISKRFKCGFINVPKIAFKTQIYLCKFMLELSTNDIAEIYEMPANKIDAITRVCHTAIMVDDHYASWVQSIYNEYKLKHKIAA